MKCKLLVKDNIDHFYDCDYDGIDFAFFIFNGEISLTEELNQPIIFKQLCKLSKESSIILFFHFVALIENKKYLSVMVIDNGRIIGVSDSITAKEFCSAKRQRIYMTSKIKAGIVVDEDIFHTDSVSSLYQNKADIIIFMTAKAVSERYLKAFYCHKFFNDIDIVAAFGNRLCFFGKDTVFGNILNEYNFNILKRCEEREVEKLINPSFEY